MDDSEVSIEPFFFNFNILKFLFPAISILIFALIFLSARGVPESEYLKKKMPKLNEFNSVDIKNGEIFGLTDKAGSFYFTSSNITYANLLENYDYNLFLDNLVGQIEYSEEDIFFANSPKAKYLFKERKILSERNVFYNKDESVFGKSTQLEIDLKGGIIQSLGPTLISGNNFFITSGYLKLIEPKNPKLGKKMILKFEDSVHASFVSRR